MAKAQYPFGNNKLHQGREFCNHQFTKERAAIPLRVVASKKTDSHADGLGYFELRSGLECDVVLGWYYCWRVNLNLELVGLDVLGLEIVMSAILVTAHPK